MKIYEWHTDKLKITHTECDNKFELTNLDTGDQVTVRTKTADRAKLGAFLAYYMDFSIMVTEENDAISASERTRNADEKGLAWLKEKEDGNLSYEELGSRHNVSAIAAKYRCDRGLHARVNRRCAACKHHKPPRRKNGAVGCGIRCSHIEAIEHNLLRIDCDLYDPCEVVE